LYRWCRSGQSEKNRTFEGVRVEIVDGVEVGGIGSWTAAPSAIDARLSLVEAGSVVGLADPLAADCVDHAVGAQIDRERNPIAILVEARELPASADETGDAVGREEGLAAADWEGIAPNQVEPVGLVGSPKLRSTRLAGMF